MLVLAIESSAQAASAALVSRDKTLAEMTVNNKKNHSVTLMPMIDFIFKTAGCDLDCTDYIAVSTGPGSFTGLRIGVAAAKGLAHGSGKKILAVPTLDALAYNITDEDGIVVPVMDARRNQVYACFYGCRNGKPHRMSDYMAADITDVISIASGYGKRVIFLGDGVSVYGDLILSANKNFALAGANNNMQRASSVALAGMSDTANPLTYDALEVFYLRKPQAERLYGGKAECIP